MICFGSFLHACIRMLHMYMCAWMLIRCLIGNVIEGPSNITYLPGLTPLPIELTCNITGVAAWGVNGTGFTLRSLTDGDLPGHNRTETNILVDSPVNNTEYICVSQTNDDSALSDPAYIIIAGEQYESNCMAMYTHMRNDYALV